MYYNKYCKFQYITKRNIVNTKVQEYGLDLLKQRVERLVSLLSDEKHTSRQMVADEVNLVMRASFMYCPEEIAHAFIVVSLAGNERNRKGFCYRCDNSVGPGETYCAVCQGRV